MKSSKIVVVGSTNMDMVVRADHIPVPGETVLSGAFFMNPGGKGANQAVAVARLGGAVIFVSRLGNDVFGQQFSQLFRDEGIDISFLLYDKDLPSGVALITVDKGGENSIVVASGANASLRKEDLAGIMDVGSGILLLQLEIPMEVVEHAVECAVLKGMKVILNPAPAATLSPGLLQKIDILTPNRTEASMIAGMPVTDMDSARKAAKVICDKGVGTVVITMGALGAVICAGGECSVVETKKVVAVDTTAAGDVFNGAIAVALSEGKNMTEAVRFACDAAAISVTRLGAQTSIPYRRELTDHAGRP
jgi:ribokinase